MDGQRTILLVDDSEDDLTLMRAAFQKAGCDNPLQKVRNGEEAIAYLKGDGPYGDRNQFPLPAVMLLDLKMPMKNGFDVLSWLRAQAGLGRLSVIVLTASTRTEDIARAFDSGANAFLVKPGTLDGLTSMVRCLCEWLRYCRFPPLDAAIERSGQARA